MFHNDRWIPLCQEKQVVHSVVVVDVGASENELADLMGFFAMQYSYSRISEFRTVVGLCDGGS